MNSTDNGPDNTSDRRVLFEEITRLKGERNQLMQQLAECRREVQQLRAQLEGRL